MDVKEVVDMYRDFFLEIPGVENVSPGPDGRSHFRIWVEDNKTKEMVEKLFKEEIEGFPIMVEIVAQGVLRDC